MSNLSVPFFSGAIEFREQWPQISLLLDSICHSGRFTSGSMVQQLENSISIYTGANYAIGVGSGTDALIIILKAVDIRPGDEIIVPCFTFIASASSIAHLGATPILTDIDPITYNIDPTSIEERITPRTRAIMPVHLFSQMADMAVILEVAAKHKIMVLEDSAEGMGMWLDGKHAGLLGQVGVFSFFPTKTLGAIGDAGMIVTNDQQIAEKCYLLRNHGRDSIDPHTSHLIGYNSRMDEIQAAVLLTRLQYLTRNIARRASIAKFYDQRLAHLKPFVKTPGFPNRYYSTNQVHYVYVIEADHRDDLVAYLDAHNIGTETYYPIPLHLQPCFSHLGYHPGDFPNAEYACKRTLALPLYPDLTVMQADAVCQAIQDFYQQGN